MSGTHLTRAIQRLRDAIGRDYQWVVEPDPPNVPPLSKEARLGNRREAYEGELVNVWSGKADTFPTTPSAPVMREVLRRG